LIHCGASLVLAPSILFLVSDPLVGQWTTNLAMLKRGLLDDALRPYMLSACFVLALVPGLVGVWSGRELILGRAPEAKGAAILAAMSGAPSVLVYLALLNVLRASGPSRLTVLASFGIRHKVPLVIALWALLGIPVAAGSSRIVRALGRRGALR
jgi:hypothetical protein